MKKLGRVEKETAWLNMNLYQIMTFIEDNF